MKKILTLLTITVLAGCTPSTDTGNNSDTPKAGKKTEMVSDEKIDNTKNPVTTDSSFGLTPEEFQALSAGLGSCVETIKCVGKSTGTDFTAIIANYNLFFKRGEPFISIAKKSCEAQTPTIIKLAPQCQK